ncbi:ABC transporter ATP-binding protein [Microbacterium pullorum]|uniref:ABC transporter ATP-binding protein n=1 Tax=Microbacterium pullorum TaxID=2762236 RepID=UPI00296B1BB3|nr:ABC transporter ATP-binding protein [Microbacterium pullorum]
MSAVQVSGLRISIGGATPVAGVSLRVAPGECLAIVGESGAGKSLTARALLGLIPDGARMTADALTVDGVDALRLDERGWRQLRGTRIALVSQDALVSLDPLRRVGAEVAEPIVIHEPRMPRATTQARVETLLTDVAMPDPARRARQYPHELSGGLRQRALIASALAGKPAVLIADEPTTALDATVQARVLDLLRAIADRGTAVVFVSHDFAAVRRVADRVAVMRGGVFIEEGTTAEVFDAPQHPHTREMLAASRHVPGVHGCDGGRETPLVSARALSKSFDRPAVQEVSFDLGRGCTLGIVGESGSGKTTLARMIVGIEKPDTGTVSIDGATWSHRDEPALRRRVQLVHQNPLGALDPRWSIGRSVREALAAGGVPRAQRRARAADLLAEVGLDAALARRRPSQISGGQRQRAAIARALAVDPDVLVLDEPVSALDPTVRERVLALLRRLQARRGLAMVFVSHDLDVIAAIADDVLVMQDGAVVEQGAVAEVFASPRHPFTRELLAAGR